MESSSNSSSVIENDIPSGSGSRNLSRLMSEPQLVLEKSPTGIQGLDEITLGGFPKGRPTLLSGGPGCGKTLFALEFLVRGALEFGEPGIFLAFEETPQDLAKNVASLGFNLPQLEEEGKILVEYIQVDKSHIVEAGDFELEGLFIRLQLAVDTIGAKRIAIDTLETIFSGFNKQAILRQEIRRLFYWLKAKDLTAVITAERSGQGLTRHGMEEYVSDCVILLDHRVHDQITTRNLRVVKYRGSSHGTNEYPFLIDEKGISVLPISSMSLSHKASRERISTGVPALDQMLEGKGFYRGSSVLVSGSAGMGKTSLCAHFADAACRRGERCLYFAFEESFDQVARNMLSIGLDLEKWSKQDLLRFHASRPTLHGLEMHLAKMHKLIEEFRPSVVIVDPISSLISMGTERETNSMLVRLIDFLKTRQISALFTSLSSNARPAALESTDERVSSIIDTWILLRDIELNGERNRGLYILKSRGMDHSRQIREFLVTSRGVDLVDVYLGPSGVVTGSTRLSLEARERAEAEVRKQDIEARQRKLERKRKAVEAQVAALMADFKAQEEDEIRIINEKRQIVQILSEDWERMKEHRGNKSGEKL